MTDDQGQSLIETVLLGLLLLVPLIWALGVLSEIQSGALGTTAAVREAGIDGARQGSVTEAGLAIDAAVTRALTDQGLDASRAEVTWTAPQGMARGGVVEVRVRYPVSILSAPFLGSVAGPSVWVDAVHSARIDPYRSR